MLIYVSPSPATILHTYYVIPTSREEPISMLDNGLNDANNLQGHGGHHLRNVSGGEEKGLSYSANIIHQVQLKN